MFVIISSAREPEEQTETTLPYDHSNSPSCPTLDPITEETLDPITEETCAVPQTSTPVSENNSQCCSHREVLKRTQRSNKRFKKIIAELRKRIRELSSVSIRS